MIRVLKDKQSISHRIYYYENRNNVLKIININSKDNGLVYMITE